MFSRKKREITKRTHFSVNINYWTLLSDYNYDEYIFRMLGKAKYEDPEDSGLQ